MTRDEITKLRELCNGATPGPLSAAWIAYALRLAGKTGLDFGDVESDTSLNSAREDDAKLFSAARTLIPQLLDALEAAGRERDEARETAEKYAIENETSVHIRVIKERDTARAQVETLAEALCVIAEQDPHDPIDKPTRLGCVCTIARAALKAAELDNTSGESK